VKGNEKGKSGAVEIKLED